MNVSEALNAAADAIEREGWWDGREHEGPTGMCASNAIARVARESVVVRIDAHQTLWDYLGGDHITAIFNWNDAPERTAAEVVEALRACAVIEAAKETDVRVVEPREAVSA